MIKFHPTDSSLVDFAEGNLAPAESLLVSAHCDMCHSCRHKLQLLTENLAYQTFAPDHQQFNNTWFSCSNDKSDEQYVQRDYITMFEHITNSTQASYSPITVAKACQQNIKTSLQLDGKTFQLPQTLIRRLNKMRPWSHLLGKLWHAPVDIGDGLLAQFIYMEKGGGVPEHTHKGNEFTLVVNGSFTDGLHTYRSGDFITLDNEHKHSPKSLDEEGCLVFCVIDQPLIFTQGWAKLINPLSHLYFKVNS